MPWIHLGAFCLAHPDCDVKTRDRLVILDLNESWQPGDGGELRLWTTPGDNTGLFELMEPRFGTLVAFLAGDR